MSVQVKTRQIKQKIQRIESMISQGIVTFNGFATVEAAQAKMAELKAELLGLDDDLLMVNIAEETARRNEKLARHKKAEKWSRQGKNDYMREFGYKWRKQETAASASDFDQYSEWREEYAVYEWQLIAPDGRRVSVEQAMSEIEAAL